MAPNTRMLTELEEDAGFEY